MASRSSDLMVKEPDPPAPSYKTLYYIRVQGTADRSHGFPWPSGGTTLSGQGT